MKKEKSRKIVKAICVILLFGTLALFWMGFRIKISSSRRFIGLSIPTEIPYAWTNSSICMSGIKIIVWDLKEGTFYSIGSFRARDYYGFEWGKYSDDLWVDCDGILCYKLEMEEWEYYPVIKNADNSLSLLKLNGEEIHIEADIIPKHIYKRRNN